MVTVPPALTKPVPIMVTSVDGRPGEGEILVIVGDEPTMMGTKLLVNGPPGYETLR